MKKIISLLLAVIMLVGIVGIGTYAAGESARFKDVKETAWYAPSLDLMYSYGVVSGFDDGCYYPTENVSLAEFSLMLYRIAQNLGADLSLKGNKAELLAGYKNCETDAWYSDAMAWLIDNGIIFVDDAMPQGPMSVIDTVGFSVPFSLLAEKLHISFTENPRCDAFKNIDELPNYAVTHVEKLRLAGILVDTYNKPGYLEIDSIRTRAQCARSFEMVFDDLGLTKPATLPEPIPRRAEDDKNLNNFEISDASEGTAVISKYIGTETAVVIPTVIANKNIVGIGAEAFKDRTDITSVEYHDGIVSIGAHAFYGCKKLKVLHVPKKVERIEEYAFWGCEYVGNVTVPITIKYIGKNAIAVGSNGSSDAHINYQGSRDDFDLVTVEDSEYAARVLENIRYSKNYHETDAFRYTPNSDGTAVITEYVGSSAYVTVPAEIDGYKITKMGANTFEKHKDTLKELIISDGIEYVDGCEGCVKLYKVTLPESVKIIDSFRNCTALESITLPDGLKTIGQWAFKGSGLKSIVIPGGIESIGSGCFEDCKSLTSVTYAEGCTKTGGHTFDGCTSLSEINLPETMEEIGWYAFHDHIAEAIVIPAKVNEIGESAFGYSKDTYMFFKGHLPQRGALNLSVGAYYFYRKGALRWHKLFDADRPEYVKIQFHSDVSYKSWYRDSVAYVLVNGLMNGVSDKYFEPNTTMTRAMLVTVLWRLDGSPAPKSSAPFGDLKQAWYRDAVAWAAENEIVLGVGGDRFDPNGSITREQMATILYRFSEYKGYGTEERASIDSFPDASKVHSYAVEALEWACGAGYITGKEEKENILLDPRGSATRAQVATILTRFDKAN